LDFSKKIVAQGVKGWAGAGAAVIPTEAGEDSVPMLVEKEGMPFLVGLSSLGCLKLPLTISTFQLTTSSFSSYLSALRTSALHYKALTLVPALVTVLLLSRRLYRLYLHNLAKKAVRDLRARRRNSRKELSNPDLEEGGPPTATREDEDLCVVCLTNKRDTVILPCGHYYLCASCVSKCADTCPVCRGEIADTVRTFS